MVWMDSILHFTKQVGWREGVCVGGTVILLHAVHTERGVEEVAQPPSTMPPSTGTAVEKAVLK
jgi:hypothetical protein